MSATVGITELRRNLRAYLRRVAEGERLVVTDRNRPGAELGPLSAGSEALDRLIAEGRVAAPLRRRRPRWIVMDDAGNALSRALDEVRGDPGA